VSVCDGRGRPVRVPGLGAWLVRLMGRAARGDVTVALVGDAVIRRLNHEFRGVDRVTDVLSFPADEPARRSGRRRPMLGDVVIASGRAASQARQAGHPIGTELRVLALHGLLHLAGYDHDSDDGRMARRERQLRRRGGLPAGLIERGTRR
jgi:probable rRNA maturation factor